MENKISKIEFKKCVQDSSYVYMIEKYLLPLHTYGKVTKLSNAQKKLFETMATNDCLYINKGRCCGLTTSIVLKVSSDVIMSEGKETFLIHSFSVDMNRVILENIKYILDNTDYGLYANEEIMDKGRKSKAEIVGNKLICRNNCTIYMVNSIEDIKGICIDDVSAIYMDEFLYGEHGQMLFKVFESYHRKNGIKMYAGSTPKCDDSPFCFNVATEYFKKGNYFFLNENVNGKSFEDLKKSMSREEFDEMTGAIYTRTYFTEGEGWKY